MQISNGRRKPDHSFRPVAGGRVTITSLVRPRALPNAPRKETGLEVFGHPGAVTRGKVLGTLAVSWQRPHAATPYG